MLDTDDIEKLMVDEVNGSPHRITGPEAEAFLIEFRKDVASAKKNGHMLDIPSEIQAGE